MNEGSSVQHGSTDGNHEHGRTRMKAARRVLLLGWLGVGLALAAPACSSPTAPRMPEVEEEEPPDPPEDS